MVGTNVFGTNGSELPERCRLFVETLLALLNSTRKVTLSNPV